MSSPSHESGQINLPNVSLNTSCPCPPWNGNLRSYLGEDVLWNYVDRKALKDSWCDEFFWLELSPLCLTLENHLKGLCRSKNTGFTLIHNALQATCTLSTSLQLFKLGAKIKLF